MSELEKLCVKWLNDNYGDLERYETEKYPDYVFHMKDGNCILEYNKKNDYVYVNYCEIWSFFESYFGMSYQQIQDLTKVWVEEHYKKEVATTLDKDQKPSFLVEEHYKKEVVTTPNVAADALLLVEEHYKKEVATTVSSESNLPRKVEEHYKKEVVTTYSSPIEDLSMVEENYKIK